MKLFDYLILNCLI